MTISSKATLPRSASNFMPWNFSSARPYVVCIPDNREDKEQHYLRASPPSTGNINEVQATSVTFSYLDSVEEHRLCPDARGVEESGFVPLPRCARRTIESFENWIESGVFGDEADTKARSSGLSILEMVDQVEIVA